MSNLLVELFVEELPPKALKKLGESFASVLFETLKAQGLASDTSAVTNFATPRRLAAHVSHVLAAAPIKRARKKLMPTSVAFDENNNHSVALKKKFESMGYIPFIPGSTYHLEKVVENGVENLYLDYEEGGESISLLLDWSLRMVLEKLPIPKVMTYQLEDGWTSVNFVRPAHGLVALHGAEIVPVSVLGLNAGNTTQGHRFEAKNATITLKNADTYAEQLSSEGAVIASFAERRAEIVRQLNAAAAKENLKPIDDDALLDEVTALVERPNVLLGQFEKEFLEVPQECLILTMKANQKYFPLLDANGKLTNKFLIVSNINPADPSAVIGGNERVVRPRLADAKFFFDQDRKKTLESRIAGLDKVIYHNKLGSQGERNARVVKIAGEIAKQIGDASLVAKVELAAHLSKTDLLTDMVGEFPELQGIMGRYYAQHEGLDDDVAFAIEDHYKPRFAGDELPRNLVGVCVAIADKLETLVGMFGIGNLPTGDKDPYGLRRHALGVIRIVLEKKLALHTNSLISIAEDVFNRSSIYADIKTYTGTGPDLGEVTIPIKLNDAGISELSQFIMNRLSVNLREQGASALEVDAVIALNPQLLAEIPKRLEAVRVFASLPEAPALAAANKRVGNILKKSENTEGASFEAKIVAKSTVIATLLQEPAEIALNEALSAVKPKADAAFEAGDYTASLQALAALKAPVDDFFDNVMVNADDVNLKNNRLALLSQLHQAMNRVADLSKLAS